MKFQINNDDGLPNLICEDCIHQISKTIAFKQQIETADATLKHYVAQGYLSGVKSSPVETFDEIEEYKSENEASTSASKILSNKLNETNEDDDDVNYDECDYLDEEIEEEEISEEIISDKKKNKTKIKIENESGNNSASIEEEESDELNTKKTSKKKIIESDSESDFSEESVEEQKEDKKIYFPVQFVMNDTQVVSSVIDMKSLIHGRRNIHAKCVLNRLKQVLSI